MPSMISMTYTAGLGEMPQVVGGTINGRPLPLVVKNRKKGIVKPDYNRARRWYSTHYRNAAIAVLALSKEHAQIAVKAHLGYTPEFKEIHYEPSFCAMKITINYKPSLFTRLRRYIRSAAEVVGIKSRS